MAGLAGLLAGGGLSVPPLAGLGRGIGRWSARRSTSSGTRRRRNLGQALARIEPQLRSIGVWLLSFVAGAGFGMLSFMAAIVIAGVLLAHSVAEPAAGRLRVAVRLMGPAAAPISSLLAEHTIRSVARGVLGTALIQSILVGIGLVVAGDSRRRVPDADRVPAQRGPDRTGAGPARCRRLQVLARPHARLGPVPGLVHRSPGSATISCGPILLSRGGDVPVWVILIGTLGGLIAHGLIGLFVGPIVMSLGLPAVPGLDRAGSSAAGCRQRSIAASTRWFQNGAVVSRNSAEAAVTRTRSSPDSQ